MLALARLSVAPLGPSAFLLASRTHLVHLADHLVVAQGVPVHLDAGLQGRGGRRAPRAVPAVGGVAGRVAPGRLRVLHRMGRRTRRLNLRFPWPCD